MSEQRRRGEGRAAASASLRAALLVAGAVASLGACDPPRGGTAPRAARVSRVPARPASSLSTATSAVGAAVAPTSATTSAAASSPEQPAAGGFDPCTACTEPVSEGALRRADIDEASGLVASRLHAGAYYVHNDSGDRARFFATDLSGADLGSFELRGADAVDWEDVALGPCPQGSCLYFADIGDNDRVRSDYALYRVAEPDRIGPGAPQTVAFERLPFRYPDGSHNAETLLAHPRTGELVVVTKVPSGPSSVYRFPATLSAGVLATLHKVAEVTPPRGTALVTGGDVHPAAAGILLRTYTDLFYVPLGTRSLGEALGSAGCRVPVATEPQGEAVAWTAAGDGWVTVSEGKHPPLYVTRCRLP